MFLHYFFNNQSSICHRSWYGISRQPCIANDPGVHEGAVKRYVIKCKLKFEKKYPFYVKSFSWKKFLKLISRKKPKYLVILDNCYIQFIICDNFAMILSGVFFKVYFSIFIYDISLILSANCNLISIVVYFQVFAHYHSDSNTSMI